MTGRIVVGTDGSEGSYQALLWALREARIHHSPVHAVITWQGPATYSRDVYFPVAQDGIAESAEAQLAALLERATAEFAGPEIVPVVLEGEPSRILCEQTEESDLLVVGSRGHGSLTGLLLGSVSSRCARHSRAPVVIVPASWRRDQVHSVSGPIVAGVDGSPGSVSALRWALEEAAIRHGSVRAVMVWRGVAPGDDDMALEWATLPSLAHRDQITAGQAGTHLAAVVSEAVGDRQVSVEQVVVEGDPAKSLCRQAAGAEMLVVGSRGHGAFAGLLLGSVSSRCAHHSPVPVAIIPAQEIRSEGAAPGPG